jgi:hypothetical protein
VEAGVGAGEVVMAAGVEAVEAEAAAEAEAVVMAVPC